MAGRRRSASRSRIRYWNFDAEIGEASRLTASTSLDLHGVNHTDEIFFGSCGKRNDLDAEPLGRAFGASMFGTRQAVGESGYSPGTRQCFMQQLNRLASSWNAKIATPVVLPFGTWHRGDKLAAKQVVRDHHDWNTLRRFLCCTPCFGPDRHQHIWTCLGQFNGRTSIRNGSHAFATAVDLKVAASDKAGSAQLIEEAGRDWSQYRNAVRPTSPLCAGFERQCPQRQ